MSTAVATALTQALTTLQRQRAHLDRQIAAVHTALNGSDGGRGRGKRAAAPRKRRGMSAEARQAVSKRMKAYWAKRRAAKSKSK